MANKLPQGWVECELGKIFLIERGGSPRPIKNYLTDDKNGINWIKIGDVQKNSKYIYSTKEKIKPEGKKHSRFVSDGDLILSNSMSFGRPYILRTSGCIHDGWVVFRNIYKLAYEDFLYYILSSQNIYNEFAKVATGSTVKNLNIDRIKPIKIKISPINEQKRIVEKIEEEFEKIDEGVEKLKSAQEQIKQYRQSVLKSAFDGKLYKTTEWEENNITNICELKSGNTIDKSLEKENGEIPYVKVGDMNIPDNIEEIITSSRFVNLCDIKEDSLIPTGAIIFPKRGGAIATNKKRKVIKPIIIDLNTMAIIPKGNILSELLYYFMIKLDLSKISNGGAVPQINHYSFENIKINLPTINEQKQLVKEIEKRFEVADEVERVITENLEKTEQLKQSILKKAFEGRLVPQDPTDQPASELLAQIQAERNK